MVVNAAAGLHVKRYGGGLQGAAEAGEVDAAQGGIIDADDLFFITMREGSNDACAEAALPLSGNGAGKGRGGRKGWRQVHSRKFPASSSCATSCSLHVSSLGAGR